MNNGRLISLKNIMWRVSTHPLMGDMNINDAAMYALEAIRLIGAPTSFENKLRTVSISEYKGRVPKDLINLRGMKHIQSNKVINYASDIYHGNHCLDDFKDGCDMNSNLTYSMESEVIKTSFKEGDILISYKSLATDDDGFPMIQDNPQNVQAIRYHIMYSHLEPFYDIGKISDKAFNRISQNRDWYIGAAQSSMVLSNIDHLETTMRAINRLIVPDDMHSDGFKDFLLRDNLTNL